MSKHQSYYMVIPAEIWDATISAKAMILYGHITVLSNKKKYCYASNSYFEEVMKSSSSTIKRIMNELESNGFIHREIIYKEGTKEVEERKIFLNLGMVKNEPNPGSINEPSPSITVDPDNSTRTNNTRTNTKSGDELLLDKIIEIYPGNANARQPLLKALKALSTEEKKLAIKNVKRYKAVANGYYLNLRNYLESKAFSEAELLKKEDANKLKNRTTKPDTKTLNNKATDYENF